jgi:hypothetical protein
MKTNIYRSCTALKTEEYSFNGMYDHPNQDWKLSKATTAEPMATEDLSTHFKSTNLFPKQIKTEN